uniref:(California timema) hypothetical protein n=1 Tax=Timema californicum TaxID=61474 RepID=A0A7R9J3U3_TIMCA|nr:unnamed protein product [Timema californicum]
MSPTVRYSPENEIVFFTVRGSTGVSINLGPPSYDLVSAFTREDSKACKTMVFDPQGKYFAWVNGVTVKIASVSTWKVITEITKPKISNLEFSPKGTYLMTWEPYLASSREAETTTRCDDELDFTEIVGFVTCLYGDFWWLACVLDSFEDKQEFKVSFLHPHGPAPSNFTYPTVPDILRVHRSSILTTVDPLTATGRVYTLTKAETENATRKLFAVKQM